MLPRGSRALASQGGERGVREGSPTVASAPPGPDRSARICSVSGVVDLSELLDQRSARCHACRLLGTKWGRLEEPSGREAEPNPARPSWT